MLARRVWERTLLLDRDEIGAAGCLESERQLGWEADWPLRDGAASPGRQSATDALIKKRVKEETPRGVNEVMTNRIAWDRRG